MIKKRQKDVLDYVKAFSSERGYAPTLEEIQGKFEFKSISTAHYHIKKLQEAGYLEKEVGRSRSLKATNINFGAQLLKKIPQYFSLPVVGSANCGPAAIYAVEEPREYVTVSAGRLGKNNKEGLFIIEAEGDSMNNSKVGANKLSVESGDYVVVDSSITSPADGDYVLSVIDGCANIKKFKKIDGRFALMSESKSKDFRPIYLDSSDDFMVNGKVVNVLK